MKGRKRKIGATPSIRADTALSLALETHSCALSYARQGDLYRDDTFDNCMLVAGVRNRGNY